MDDDPKDNPANSAFRKAILEMGIPEDQADTFSQMFGSTCRHVLEKMGGEDLVTIKFAIDGHPRGGFDVCIRWLDGMSEADVRKSLQARYIALSEFAGWVASASTTLSPIAFSVAAKAHALGLLNKHG